MVAKRLSVESLLLDLENPRISKASDQRDALAKLLADQKAKLVALAESIVNNNGLNPIERLLVISANKPKGKFIVIEGNRRLAAIKILKNPSVLGDVRIAKNIRRKFEKLSERFDIRAVEKIDCVVLASRELAAVWIQQRHTGENKGQGIVDWSGLARERFRGQTPALQALDFAEKNADLSEAEREAIRDRFPISTLARLIETPSVRARLGLELVGGKLTTRLPDEEVIKPLQRIVKDLVLGKVTVSDLKKVAQQDAYVGGLGRSLPDLGKAIHESRAIWGPLEGNLGDSLGGENKKRRKKSLGREARSTLIPRSNINLNITNERSAEIFKELQRLKISEYPNAISVLFRVFLEISTEHYLKSCGISLSQPNSNGREKKFRDKLGDAIAQLEANGIPRNSLDGLRRGISDRNSPLSIDLLHSYVHNRFLSPTERDLRIAWDNSAPFFEAVWK